MYNKSGVVTDQSTAQVPVAGALIYVLDGNRALAALFDASGDALPNPLITDDLGSYLYFVQTPGYYTQEYWWASRKRAIEQVGIGPIPGDAVSAAASAAEAKSYRDQSSTSAADAAASYTQTSADRVQTGLDRSAVETDKETVEGLVDQARAAATLSGFYPDAAKDNVPRHATGVGAVTGGSGGTDGTYNLAFTGGNFDIAPTGTFTVSGGAVTAIQITGGGLYIGNAISAPTLDFSAATGLTGAAASLTTGFVIPSGGSYLVARTGENVLTLYFNEGGVATISDPLVTVIKTIEFADEAAAIAGTSDDTSLTPKSGKAAIDNAVNPSSSMNRWSDAFFRALRDANTSDVGANFLNLDGKVKVASSASDGLTWDDDSSPFGNPAVVSSAIADFYHYFDDGLFQVGEGIAAKIGLIVPTGSTYTVDFFIRNGYAGTVLASLAEATVVGTGEYQEIDLGTLANVEGGAALNVRLIRTVGSDPVTVCALQAVPGPLARPMGEDVAPAYRANTAYKIATDANSLASGVLEFSGLINRSKNLFNPDDPDVTANYYVLDSNGELAPNTSYTATGYIPVKEGAEYSRSFAGYGAWFDFNKVYVSGITPANANPLVAPANGYVRLSTYNFDTGPFQFEQSSASTAYTPYSAKIDPSYLPSDGGGVAATYHFNEHRMRRFRYLARKRLLGEACQIVIAFIGDSYTQLSARYIEALTDQLVDLYGDAGGGWVGFASNAGSVNGNVRPSLYPLTRTGTWGEGDSTNYVGSTAPDIGRGVSSTAGDAYHVAGPATPVLSAVRFFWEGTSDGVMRYRWNGGAWTTINVQGSGQQSALLAGLPASGAWTLDLEVVSGTCKPQGVDLQSAASGIRVHKLGATGSKAQHWAAADATGWETSLGLLGLTSAVVLLGTNDEFAGRTADQFNNDLTTIGTRIAAAVPAIDLMLAMPAENQSGNAIKMADYAAKASVLALAQDWAFLNFQPLFGDASNPNEYGSDGAIPLYASDDTHPDPATGGRLIADGFYRLLTSL